MTFQRPRTLDHGLAIQDLVLKAVINDVQT